MDPKMSVINEVLYALLTGINWPPRSRFVRDCLDHKPACIIYAQFMFFLFNI